jgi:hypothetical protein
MSTSPADAGSAAKIGEAIAKPIARTNKQERTRFHIVQSPLCGFAI